MLEPKASYNAYLSARLRDALLHITPMTALICFAFVPFNLAFRADDVRWQMAAMSLGAGCIASLYGLALWRRPSRWVVELGGPALMMSVAGMTAANAVAGEEAGGAAYLGVIALAAGAVLVRWSQMLAVTATVMAAGFWVWTQSPQSSAWFEIATAELVAAVSGVVVFRVRAQAFHTSFATRQREVENRLRYERAMAGSDSALWEYAPATGVLTLAPRWAATLGYDPEDRRQPQRLDLARAPEDRPAVIAMLECQCEDDAPPFSLEHRLLCADGTYRWMLVSGKSSPDSLGSLRLAGAFVDIHDRVTLESHLRHEALHDRLTGLANRRLLMERLEQQASLARRHPERTFAIVFFDLDGFKRINDDWGHAAGDRVLIETAARLRESSREEDIVARHGGDELVVLVQDAPTREGAEHYANRIARALEQPIEIEPGTFVRVGASAGVAWSGEGFANGRELLERADAAMYEAKRAKKEGGRKGGASEDGAAVGTREG